MGVVRLIREGVSVENFKRNLIKGKFEPLRILFCGSDQFSIASLKRLCEERSNHPSLIKSIDVLVRPGKFVGRNLKTFQHVPLKPVAQQLGLRIHERDTLTGWHLPQAEGEHINLIVAVSFGLFIPSRILSSALYGGLNVHPSVLPQYRGPAPLEHTIMQGDKVTGVTLQTMDEKSFDHGTILRQETISIPDHKNITYQKLMDVVKPMGADILARGLIDRLFVPPLHDVGLHKPTHLIHAAKITPATREVHWSTVSPTELNRRYRALGPRLWTNILVREGVARRAIFNDIQHVEMPVALRMWFQEVKFTEPEGRVVPRESDADVHFFMYERAGVREDMPQMYIVDADGKSIIIANRAEQPRCVRVREITVEGKAKQPAAQAMRAFKDREAWDLSRSASGRIRGDPKTGEGGGTEDQATYL